MAFKCPAYIIVLKRHADIRSCPVYFVFRKVHVVVVDVVVVHRYINAGREERMPSTSTKLNYPTVQDANKVMMIDSKFLSMATLALFALISQAELLFYNPGTQPANWDYVRREHQGTVDQINNVVYKGDTALKMTQTYDSNYDGRYHSEVDHNDGYRPGDTRYYGFMFRLSEAWEFSPQGYNIAQFIADRNGAGCDEDDWMPSSMVWIKGDQLTSRIVSGNYRQPDCSREFDQLDDLATVSAGVWHKVIIKATWETDSTGQYTMWFDDEQVRRLDICSDVSAFLSNTSVGH